MQTITSLQNERVKRAIRLRQGQHRRRSGLTLIDGPRELRLAAQAGWKIEELFWYPARADDGIADLAHELERQGAWVASTTQAVQERLSYGQACVSVVAVARAPTPQLELLQPPVPSTVVVLERLEKPGNLGAIARTASAAGVAAILVVDGVGDLFNPNAIRASRGAIFSLPVVSVSLGECLVWLRSQNLHPYAADPAGKLDYTDAALGQHVALILGSEAHGLTDRWQTASVHRVRIPMEGPQDSLNVSVSAALLIYEARRQRLVPG